MSLFSRRDFLKLSGLALAASAFSRFDLPAIVSNGPVILYHGSRNFRKVAIAFDDCWHPKVLDQLMGMVAPYPGFHLTFFAIGDAILIGETLSPGIWKRIYQSGHEIGYHTMHHTDMMSSNDMLADFDQWINVLQQVLGFLPEVHFAKAPGNYVSKSFEILCSERGLVDTRYSIGYEAETVDEGLLYATRTQNGDIVQMHTYQDPPHGRFDVDITVKVVPYLAEQGFTLVTMSQLYDDVLRDQFNSNGCDIGAGQSLTRTCIE